MSVMTLVDITHLANHLLSPSSYWPNPHHGNTSASHNQRRRRKRCLHREDMQVRDVLIGIEHTTRYARTLFPRISTGRGGRRDSKATLSLMRCRKTAVFCRDAVSPTYLVLNSCPLDTSIPPAPARTIGLDGEGTTLMAVVSRRCCTL